MSTLLSSQITTVNDNLNQLRTDVARGHDLLRSDIDQVDVKIDQVLGDINDLAVDVGRIEGRLEAREDVSP